uniref:Uncharacterized protein n=1 Tax=Ditylenchus dipsaci TaxID=166011 RepID=A0A915CRK4_9BILA
MCSKQRIRKYMGVSPPNGQLQQFSVVEGKMVEYGWMNQYNQCLCYSSSSTLHWTVGKGRETGKSLFCSSGPNWRNMGWT